jgi:hypothetical protein
VLVLLDEERLKSNLPDVSAPTAMPKLAADMRRQQPLHPAAEIAVSRRPDDQMDMIGNEAAQQRHRQTHRGPYDRLKER